MEPVSFESSDDVMFVHAELHQTHVDRERTLKLLHQQKWESRYALNSPPLPSFSLFLFVVVVVVVVVVVFCFTFCIDEVVSCTHIC